MWSALLLSATARAEARVSRDLLAVLEAQIGLIFGAPAFLHYSLRFLHQSVEELGSVSFFGPVEYVSHGDKVTGEEEPGQHSDELAFAGKRSNGSALRCSEKDN